MNDQIVLERMDDALCDLLDHITDVAEAHDLSPPEVMGVLVMAEMWVARGSGISAAGLARLDKIRQFHANEILK
jgi:hypothetical protein